MKIDYENRIIYGFHGCDLSIKQKVLNGELLRASTNTYDWLGNGVYFWEYDEDRALEWAKQQTLNPQSTINSPAVIGAKIRLGKCLDLTQIMYTSVIKEAYDVLVLECKMNNNPLPRNEKVVDGRDWVIRYLDCSVVEIAAAGYPYDSVRAAFYEGEPLYKGANFYERTHIQLAVRNYDCILDLW